AGSRCPGAARHALPWSPWCRSFRGLLDRRAAKLGGGELNGLDDVLITGAAAEIPGDAETDLVLARIWVLLEQAIGTHDHARRAVAALQPVHFAEAFLQRVQRAVGRGHAFDGEEIAALRLHGEHGAGFDRSAVEIDRAGAAMAGVAADMRAGQVQVFAQEMDE